MRCLNDLAYMQTSWRESPRARVIDGTAAAHGDKVRTREPLDGITTWAEIIRRYVIFLPIARHATRRGERPRVHDRPTVSDVISEVGKTSSKRESRAAHGAARMTDSQAENSFFHVVELVGRAGTCGRPGVQDGPT